jgi:soluble lytic murein transglycosylase-like protein
MPAPRDPRDRDTGADDDDPGLAALRRVRKSVRKSARSSASSSGAPRVRRSRPRPRAAGISDVAVGLLGDVLHFIGRGLDRGLRALWRWYSRAKRKTQVRVAFGVVVTALVAPVLAINLLTAYFGQSVIFPLSPFFLKEKVIALSLYAAHRPICAFIGHPETATLVAEAEVRYRLPRGLLAAVIQTESAGRPHRISSAGAMGPGQLMPGTARLYGVGDPFNSESNVDGAARLLADHMARFGKIRLAVAAYNAGPGAVRGRVPQNGETPAYVAKVMQNYRELRPRPKRVSRL